MVVVVGVVTKKPNASKIVRGEGGGGEVQVHSEFSNCRQVF